MKNAKGRLKGCFQAAFSFDLSVKVLDLNRIYDYYSIHRQ
jgi:hypothetical protein